MQRYDTAPHAIADTLQVTGLVDGMPVAAIPQTVLTIDADVKAEDAFVIK